MRRLRGFVSLGIIIGLMMIMTAGLSGCGATESITAGRYTFVPKEYHTEPYESGQTHFFMARGLKFRGEKPELRDGEVVLFIATNDSKLRVLGHDGKPLGRELEKGKSMVEGNKLRFRYLAIPAKVIEDNDFVINYSREGE